MSTLNVEKKQSFTLQEKIGDLSLSKNMLINSDNLLALPELCKSYTGKIDQIYIDPPYNTGKKMGKYNDNYNSHSNWVEFIKPRLMLAKQLLSDNGSIWISIGETEEAYLKILCNTIFGEKNKIASIVWQSKYTIANDKCGISSQIEYILVYAKNIKNITINSDPLRDEYVKSTYKNIDNDPRGKWRGGIQLYKKKNKYSYTVESPTGKKWTLPWNYSEDQWYNKLVKENLIYWGKDGNSCPVKKVFLKDTKGIAIKNLWLGEEVGYTADGSHLLENMFNKQIFLYPKPVSLMKRILQVGCKPNAVTMDFFAGTGTWGQAVLEYNKQTNSNITFILVTNNENNICEDITLPRLKKVINGYIGKNKKTYEPSPGNIYYFK